MERNRVIGLSIDLFKYIVVVTILAYAWYLVAAIVQHGYPVQVIVQLQETQQIYLYYIILATIAMLYYVASALLDKSYAPTYSKLFSKTQLFWAIVFILVYSIAYLFGLFSNGFPQLATIATALPFAIVLGVQGLVENMFFIGTLGFGMKYELTERDISGSILLAAIFVAFVAMMWHLYIYISVTMVGGTLYNVIQVAASVFTFFFFGALLSFSNDNTWTWDIVHFTVNFLVALAGAHGYVIIF
ncbi:MAG: hypothetical protein ACP5GJ_03585 [Nanopusillaceae archaeon]